MRNDDKAFVLASKNEVLDCGVDWLTATSKKDTIKHEQVLASWYEVFRQWRHDNGLMAEASFLGYQGVTSEGMFIGTRYDGAMLRMSGKAARKLWQQIWLEECKITRLDVQVTVQWEGAGFHPARLAAMQAEGANATLPPNRQRNIEEHKDNKGGFTCYIGSRQSASFSRCYHKSAQDPDSYGEGAWRYEVQYNADAAPTVYQAMHKHEGDIEAAAIALVWDWYERRGVIPVFRRSASVVPVSRETISLTTLDKKLAWLYTQVRPSVAELLDQGYETEVLVALLGNILGRNVVSALQSQESQAMSRDSSIVTVEPYGDPDTP